MSAECLRHFKPSSYKIQNDKLTFEFLPSNCNYRCFQQIIGSFDYLSCLYCLKFRTQLDTSHPTLRLITAIIGPKTFQIVFIDTVLLAGIADHRNKFGELSGPADEAAAMSQWQWINATLGNSTADYLWVAGHYPVWSVCEHGPTQVRLYFPV